MTPKLSTANEFIASHIGPRQADEQAMLATLGFESLDALSASVIPESIKGTSVLNLPAGQSEADALASIKAIAAKNQLCKTYIGQGYYNCHTPSPILRNLLKTRPGTPRTRRINPRFPKAASKPCSTSRP